MRTALGLLRRSLDAVYLACGIAAALSLVAILLIIVAQVVARWSGTVFPGATSYAGYCMASASFLGFAYGLHHGAHIRVRLFLSALGRYRRYGEIWCYAVGTLLCCYFAWYAIRAVRWSYTLNDISQGQDATPLWIPQLVMAAGTVLLTLCMLDHFVQVLFTGKVGIESERKDPSG